MQKYSEYVLENADRLVPVVVIKDGPVIYTEFGLLNLKKGLKVVIPADLAKVLKKQGYVRIDPTIRDYYTEIWLIKKELEIWFKTQKELSRKDLFNVFAKKYMIHALIYVLEWLEDEGVIQYWSNERKWYYIQENIY